jgi:putative hydrolase of the HAD superfamily
LTDGFHETQRKKVHALNLHTLVDKILYSDDMKLSKPNELLYVTLEKSFQCSGNELVYIGDNPNKDFIGAKKRGWHTIRVLTGEFANQVVSKNLDGDVALNNLSELQSLLH